MSCRSLSRSRKTLLIYSHCVRASPIYGLHKYKLHLYARRAELAAELPRALLMRVLILRQYVVCFIFPPLHYRLGAAVRSTAARKWNWMPTSAVAHYSFDHFVGLIIPAHAIFSSTWEKRARNAFGNIRHLIAEDFSHTKIIYCGYFLVVREWKLQIWQQTKEKFVNRRKFPKKIYHGCWI